MSDVAPMPNITSVPNVTTTMNVTWKPTPSDRPLLYNASDPMNDHCDQKSDNYMPGNITQSALWPKWDEDVPEGKIVCTIANSSYVYSCCEMFGGETRFGCKNINCLVDSSRESDWRDCTHSLQRILNDSSLSLELCAAGDNLVAKPKNTARATTVSKAALGVMVLLAAATVAA